MEEGEIVKYRLTIDFDDDVYFEYRGKTYSYMNVLICGENNHDLVKKKKDFTEKLQFVDWNSTQHRIDAGLILSFLKHGEFGTNRRGNMSATFEEVEEETFDEVL